MTTTMRALPALERVATKQRDYDARRALLLAAMAVPFVLGWVAGKSAVLLWAAVSWLWAAAVVGWQVARTDDNTETRGSR